MPPGGSIALPGAGELGKPENCFYFALSAILKAIIGSFSTEGSAVPSRKEIQWSQLRVGALVMTAMAVLVGLILLMSSSSGGLFARKLVLRSYFENAAGLKNGAPVTLEGVTIGNVIHVRVVPDRNPTPVEVTMRVGYEYLSRLHTDSTASIAQAGVLGDSFIDIDSTHASGPPPASNAELKASGSPSIQDVIRTSNDSIEEIQTLTRKIETLVDSLNSRRGTVGALINDPELARKITLIATDLEAITGAIADGKGSLGKMVNDDTLYTRANSAIDRLDRITTALDEGKGSAGKFLKDDTLYNNLNAAVSNTNQMVAQINAGKGALGKIATDPVFAQKLDDTVTRLDKILAGVDEGKGSLGQLVQNRALYDHADQTLDQAQQLVKSIRNDPKKYLVIRLKIF
jgi:phospholipid/cholesterol/gamma-HCH transport system substrate-binding protein